MPDNTVSISVGGRKYSGWTEVSVTRSLETLASSFRFSAVNDQAIKQNQDWPLATQEECIVRIGNDALITGYIDTVSGSINPESHRLTLRGRDNTCDLVDCSAVGSPSSFNKINFLNLARALTKPFGIPVKLAPGTNPGKEFKFTVNSSETVFEVLAKKSKELGVILVTDGKGNLVIANSGEMKADDSLQYGKNIISARADYSFVNRFSKYIVHAQAPDSQQTGWGAKLNITGTATDEQVKRHRPLLIQAGGQMSNAFAIRTAQWEALIRAGKSQVVEVTVQGFRQSSGKIWEVNKVVDVKIPALFVTPATNLLIVEVEYTLNASGSRTRLVLKRKDAFTAKPKPKVTKQNNLGW